ncbi:hypothetical protein V8F33_007443 [Rhypophila sp. PSN 637]
MKDFPIPLPLLFIRRYQKQSWVPVFRPSQLEGCLFTFTSKRPGVSFGVVLQHRSHSSFGCRTFTLLHRCLTTGSYLAFMLVLRFCTLRYHKLQAGGFMVLISFFFISATKRRLLNIHDKKSSYGQQMGFRRVHQRGDKNKRLFCSLFQETKKISCDILDPRRFSMFGSFLSVIIFGARESDTFYCGVGNMGSLCLLWGYISSSFVVATSGVHNGMKGRGLASFSRGWSVMGWVFSGCVFVVLMVLLLLLLPACCRDVLLVISFWRRKCGLWVFPEGLFCHGLFCVSSSHRW